MVQITLQLSGLFANARGNEHQPIGCKQLAKFGVGQTTAVGRIARPLELLERKRLSAIVRRKLIDDESMSAGTSDAGQLGDRPFRRIHVMQRPEAPCKIERRIAEREPRRIASDERHIGKGRRPRPRYW